MKTPVFVIYPEIYVLIQEAVRDGRFDGIARKRLMEILATWEAALSEYGDRVEKVEMFYVADEVDEDEGATGLSFKALEIANSNGDNHWQ